MSRIEYALQARGSFEFLRELELRDFLKRTSSLDDIMKLFTKKLILVNSNQSATFTLLEELIWTVLTSLWDNDYLLPKVEILNRMRSASPTETVSAALMEAKLSSKTKELANAMTTIGVLENRLDQLMNARAQEQQRRPSDDMSVQVSPFTAPFECLISVSNQTECVHSMTNQSFGFEISSAENEPREADLMISADVEMHIPSSGADAEPGIRNEHLCGSELFSTRLTKEYGGDYDTIAAVDDTETREVTPESPYADISSTGPLPELSEKDISEVRIYELLQEIAEKDEIINVVSEELKRVSARVRDFGTSPRRSTAPSSRRMTPVDLTIPGIVSESVCSALDETQGEIALLKAESECLRMTICELEAENNRLSSQLEMSTTAGGPIHDQFVEELIQTEMNNVALTTRKLSAVSIEGDGGDEMRLRRELDEERIKTRNALDETERVKMCIDELERQLASLQFQLRRAGVKHEHIHTAMMKSGLTNLLRVSRAVVFERLYQDALDRIKRMERIRQQVMEIQQRHYSKKFASSGMSPDGPILARDIPHTLVTQSHNQEHHMLGGGFAGNIHSITHLPRSPSYSLDLKRVLKILPYRLLT